VQGDIQLIDHLWRLQSAGEIQQFLVVATLISQCKVTLLSCGNERVQNSGVHPEINEMEHMLEALYQESMAKEK
jgi:hypothetical protein